MLNLCFSSFIKWDGNADFSILDTSLPEMTQGSVLGFLFSKQSASPATHSHLPHLITQAQTESLYLHSLPAWKTLISSRSILSTASPTFTLGSLRPLKLEFHPPNPTSSLPRCPFSDVPKSVSGTTTHSVIHVEIAPFQFIFFSSLTSTFPHFPSSMGLDS